MGRIFSNACEEDMAKDGAGCVKGRQGGGFFPSGGGGGPLPIRVTNHLLNSEALTSTTTRQPIARCRPPNLGLCQLAKHPAEACDWLREHGVPIRICRLARPLEAGEGSRIYSTADYLVPLVHVLT